MSIARVGLLRAARSDNRARSLHRGETLLADAPPTFGESTGELLNFHPHVHVLVTDGGFRPDGTFRPLVWFDPQQVERLAWDEGAGEVVCRSRPAHRSRRTTTSSPDALG